jgi:hypothetical protein
VLGMSPVYCEGRAILPRREPSPFEGGRHGSSPGLSSDILRLLPAANDDTPLHLESKNAPAKQGQICLSPHKRSPQAYCAVVGMSTGQVRDYILRTMPLQSILLLQDGSQSSAAASGSVRFLHQRGQLIKDLLHPYHAITVLFHVCRMLTVQGLIMKLRPAKLSDFVFEVFQPFGNGFRRPSFNYSSGLGRCGKSAALSSEGCFIRLTCCFVACINCCSSRFSAASKAVGPGTSPDPKAEGD